MITVTIVRISRRLDPPSVRSPEFDTVSYPAVALVWYPEQDQFDALQVSQQVAMVTAEKMKAVGWNVVVRGE